MIETKDIYWLAGLLEGEGCFTGISYPVRQGSGSMPRIQLRMCDRDIVERAARLLGPRVRVTELRPTGKGWQSQYGLYVAGSLAIQWMQTIFCLMGKRRQEIIRETLGRWKETRSRGTWDRRLNAQIKDAEARAAIAVVAGV